MIEYALRVGIDLLKQENRRLEARAETAEAANERLRKALIAASHALRSYQYDNGSTELAKSVADACDAAMEVKP